MSLDEKLREKLNESAIILEANRDVGPQKYEIALNLFLDDAIAQIKQAFFDEGYVTVDKRRYRDEYNREYLQYTFPNEFVRVPQFSYMTKEEWFKKYSPDTPSEELMTGAYWYEKFVREYHNKADWIAGDETMGDDAEHDVLLCARLAAGLQND